MKYLALYFLIVLLVTQAFAFEAHSTMTVSDLLAMKKAAAKKDIFGRSIRTNLQQRGAGISDGQEKYVLNLMSQSSSIFGDDLVGMAKFIAQKVEDSFSGKWNVQIFEDDPSWGRSTHISDDKWLVYFGWGEYQLDFIIWAPDC